MNTVEKVNHGSAISFTITLDVRFFSFNISVRMYDYTKSRRYCKASPTEAKAPTMPSASVTPTRVPANNPPWLSVRGLGRRVGRRALLDDVSFELRPGELVALVGPNGAGKSTLVKCLAGLIDDYHGDIEIEGRPLARYRPRERARKVCYVAQAGDRPPPFTVREFVRLARYAHDDDGAGFGVRDDPGDGTVAPPASAGDRRRRRDELDALAIGLRACGDYDAVEDALERTGMTPFAERLMSTLSGGERQMAALAAALAQEAGLLLLDEPAAFLDLRHQETILELLANLHRERGQTCLMVTHDVNAALHASRRVLALREGRLLYDGPADGLADGRLLSSVFDTDFAFVTHPLSGKRTVASVGAKAARRLDFCGGPCP